MARIRSVHPGLFTDEAFVGLSSDAQVLLIGLWTECDDQGVFEWKPNTIRMRLRPVKDGPVEPLLSELEAANCMRRYEVNGRQLCAIRNFREYQKPKSPKAWHPITDEIRKYTAPKKDRAETNVVEVPPIPPNGEITPLMEGRGEEGKGSSEAKASAEIISPDKALFDYGKRVLGKSSGGLVSQLKAAFGTDGAWKILRGATEKSDAREWVAGALSRARENPDGGYQAWEDEYYRTVS
jgi:hypothetical protein